jgi:Zn-dependent protease
MKWSVNIGKIFGINFRIHVTFFLLLFFIFISVLNQRDLHSAILATLFICAIFVCVLIHEIGHSLIARRFGKETKSITLLPIGGVATMEEMPEKPAQEIAMSIVGPLINLAIAVVLFLFVGRWAGIGAPNMYPDSSRAFFAELIGVNIMLAIFNLIPAFPMDGGRVLRGILATRMDYVRATSAAVVVGQCLAMLFILFGIFFNWWLALIGLFLYIGAGSEKRQVILKSLLHDVPASEVMVREFRALRPGQTLSQALEQFYHGCQEDFPIIGEKGLDVPISEVIDASFTSINPQTPLEDVYRALLSKQKTAVAVVDKGNFEGIVCLDSISRYFMVKAAMRK